MVKKESEVSSASEYAEGVHRAHHLERGIEKLEIFHSTIYLALTLCMALSCEHDRHATCSHGAYEGQEVPPGIQEGQSHMKTKTKSKNNPTNRLFYPLQFQGG